MDNHQFLNNKVAIIECSKKFQGQCFEKFNNCNLESSKEFYEQMAGFFTAILWYECGKTDMLVKTYSENESELEVIPDRVIYSSIYSRMYGAYETFIWQLLIESIEDKTISTRESLEVYLNDKYYMKNNKGKHRKKRIGFQSVSAIECWLEKELEFTKEEIVSLYRNRDEFEKLVQLRHDGTHNSDMIGDNKLIRKTYMHICRLARELVNIVDNIEMIYLKKIAD